MQLFQVRRSRSLVGTVSSRFHEVFRQSQRWIEFEHIGKQCSYCLGARSGVHWL